MMLFAALVKKWDDCILISADSAGLKHLDDELSKKNEFIIHSNNSLHNIYSIDLKIKIYSSRNSYIRNDDNIILNLTCSTSASFMSCIRSVESSDKPCHQYFDLDREIAGFDLSVIVSNGEYLIA